MLSILHTHQHWLMQRLGRNTPNFKSEFFPYDRTIVILFPKLLSMCLYYFNKQGRKLSYFTLGGKKLFQMFKKEEYRK